MSDDREPGDGRRASSTQLARQWAVLKLLESRDYSIRELAETLGASKSSIQRDLSTLQEHFMIITNLEGQQKRLYRLIRGGPPKSLRINHEEMRALEEVIEQLRDGQSDRLRTLALKLRPFVDDE